MIRIFTLMLLGLVAASQVSTPGGGITITLERTGCSLDFSCPVYKITLAGDGSVVYEGRHAVHALGIRKSKIEPSAVRQLAQTLIDKGYFDFPTMYGVCDDGPSVKTSIELNSRTKAIEDSCHAGPSELRKLEDEIDRVSGSKRWVGGSPRS